MITLHIHEIIAQKNILLFLSGMAVLLLCRRSRRVKEALLYMHSFEHEATHGLICIICGGKVRSLSIVPSGGTVELTRSNLFVKLSPYCIPLLALCVLVLTFLLQTKWRPLGLMLSGFLFGNYLLNAFSSLGCQPDIHQTGRLVAYPLILSANVMSLVLAAFMIKVL